MKTGGTVRANGDAARLLAGVADLVKLARPRFFVRPPRGRTGTNFACTAPDAFPRPTSPWAPDSPYRLHRHGGTRQSRCPHPTSILRDAWARLRAAKEGQKG